MLIITIWITIIILSLLIIILCGTKDYETSEVSIIGEVIDDVHGGYVFKDDSGCIYSKYIVFALDEILDKHDMNWTECDKKYEIIIRELE
jgi:hypothetical protein